MASEQVVWRGKVISAIMKAAFFSQAHPKILQAAKDSFFKCLNHPTKQLSDYLALLQKMLDTSNELLAEPSTPKHKLLGKEATRMSAHIQEMISKLRSEEKTLEIQVNKLFQVLYYQMGIQLFNNPSGAVEMVEELDQCLKNASKSFNKTSEEITMDTNEPEWLEVIVDLLVSLLSQNNHFWRTVVQVVFRLLCPYMTTSALAIITDVLNPEKQGEIIIKEGEEIQQPEGDDDDDDGGSDDDSDSDEEQDEENEDDTEDENEGSDEASEAEDSDDESEEDATENEENIFEIQKKMLTVLGDVDTEVDMDSVPDSEFRLIDKKLGALLSQYIGKQKKKNKNRMAEDETAMMHFRTRVCDLLDIYVKEAHSMSLMISLVVPLLKIIRSINSDKRQEDLQNRLRSLLTQLAKVKKFKSTDGVSIEIVVDELEKLFHTTAHMPQGLSDIVGGCYSLLHNCGHQLLGEDAHKLDNPMVVVYRKHLDAFFSQRDLLLSVQAYISPLLSANGGMWSIASLLINHAFNPQTRLFRRTQSLQLLLRLYQNSPALANVKEEEMVSIEQEISEKSHIYIASLQQALDVKVEYLSNMFDLLRSIHMYHAKSDGMNWETLTEGLVAFRQRVAMRTIKPVNGAYHRLAHALKLPQLPKASNLSEEEKKIAKGEKKRKREEKAKKYKQKKAEMEGNKEGKNDNEKENNSTEKTNETINTPEVDDKSVAKNGSKSKKKRKTNEFYENRKLRLGAKTLEDLDEFNFAQVIHMADNNMEDDTAIEETVNTQEVKIKKNKKFKGKKVKKENKSLNQAPVTKKKKDKKKKVKNST
ncbi:unnamed protein product [Meganyctiphanes norvegica]|uniref:Myb-binding protein 1A n=1 Tax=Meganyctiphanes norvegica TaxID=48144 RepID=A0AAV2SNA2_MEGNR